MRTYIIKELRKNEKGETFEVETKMECPSLKALIQTLETKPNIVWGNNYAIKEEKHT